MASGTSERDLASRPAEESPRLSTFRAWCALAALSLRRQFKLRQMVWISLGLLLLTAGLVRYETMMRGWGAWERRALVLRTGFPAQLGKPSDPFDQPRPRIFTHREYLHAQTLAAGLPQSALAQSVRTAVLAAYDQGLQRTHVFIFSRWAMFGVVLAVLLPLWSLSFATDALGGERESRTMVWLISRPIPRPWIYLAKFLGVLPWVVFFNLFGFMLICLMAGDAGRVSWRLYWPAILLGSLAYTALFQLIGATCPKPTIVGLAYTFVLETILGDLPGTMKRASITYYIRCMMFAAAEKYALTPEKPSVYQPVSGSTAVITLGVVTVVLLGLGMVLFARAEYREEV